MTTAPYAASYATPLVNLQCDVGKTYNSTIKNRSKLVNFEW